jgi:hypothetical protein
MPARLHRHALVPAADASHFADVREVETLRQIARRELRTHGGQRTLAREIGVHRETLRKFVEGQSLPTQPNLELIRDWAANRPEARMPMALVALAVMVEDLPPSRRPGARKRLAGLMAELYGETAEGVPGWVADELRGLGKPPAG